MGNDARPRRSEPAVGDQSFDAYYFAHCCGKPYGRNQEWLTFFGAIADRIVTDIGPKRVLDAGCALGLLVETLRDRGVDAVGIDLSSFAVANVYDPIKPYCRHGSVADEFTETYDLIVSIEVVEHMPTPDAERAIANFCRHTDDVLFSSSSTDYREPTHVNVHPPEYWAEQFARHGFYRDVDFDASFVTPWAARFRRVREPFPRIVRQYERRFCELWSESREARSYSAKVQQELARTLEQLASTQGELETARRVRSEIEAELNRRAATLAQLEQTLAEREAALTHARGTIENMERSLFWRARSAWAWLSRLLGRPT